MRRYGVFWELQVSNIWLEREWQEKKLVRWSGAPTRRALGAKVGVRILLWRRQVMSEEL